MPDLFLLPVAELTYHHLDSLAAEVHRTYFFKYPPLPVRWGQQITRKRRRSIRLGSYNHLTCEIRIHPLLNAPNIPAFFIQSIIHHEYLHHVLGASHNRRFHAAERKFAYYRESQEWIRRNLFLLLGRKKSELVRPGTAAPMPERPAPTPQLALF
jgi:CRISPR/Cas system CMR subunit Cmr6 (Cas7 group RAMP superfamily)